MKTDVSNVSPVSFRHLVCVSRVEILLDELKSLARELQCCEDRQPAPPSLNSLSDDELLDALASAGRS